MQSAPTSSASFIAMAKAAGSSGFGTLMVEKFGSGSSCSLTMYTFSMPISLRMRRTGLLPEPCSGV